MVKFPTGPQTGLLFASVFLSDDTTEQFADKWLDWRWVETAQKIHPGRVGKVGSLMINLFSTRCFIFHQPKTHRHSIEVEEV